MTSDMAVSGSTDWSINAGQLVTLALRRTNIIGEDDQASGAQMQDGIVELNLMLKSWQMSQDSPNLWRQIEGSVPLVASTRSYALSPRPYRVISARYRNTSGIDLSMFEMTREEYQEMPNKGATGIPTSYYVDYQRDAVTMYVWPVPIAVTTETIAYDYQRRFDDIDSMMNDIDIPQEYHDCVMYCLAERLAVAYGKELPLVSARARELFANAAASDREGIVRFSPYWRR